MFGACLLKYKLGINKALYLFVKRFMTFIYDSIYCTSVISINKLNARKWQFTAVTTAVTTVNCLLIKKVLNNNNYLFGNFNCTETPNTNTTTITVIIINIARRQNEIKVTNAV